MSMTIGTNMASLVAQRSLNESGRDMGVAMERLATGSKINSAADDAAGLALASRMAGQISGLDAASKNITDGIALSDAIEGSLEEVGDILQRMRGLAVQAASDTTTNTDRTLLNNELVALKNELTALSSRVKFSGQNLLDGSFTSKSIQVGANANETITITQSSIAASSIGAFTMHGDVVGIGVGADASAAQTAAGTGTTGFTITGNGSTTGTLGNAASDSAKSVAAEINAETASTGVSATAETRIRLAFTNTQDIQINGQTIDQFAVTSNATIMAAINAHSATTGVVAVDTGTTGTIELRDADGDNILIANTSTTGTASVTTYDPNAGTFGGAAAMQVNDDAGAGTNTDTVHAVGFITATSATTFSSSNGEFLGGNSVANSYVSSATLTSQSNATSAISTIDGAINRVAAMRADLGAVANRLEHAFDSTVMLRDSTANARAKIVDTDYSAESANLAKNQVLQQVGTAMLAQANAAPQMVLQLIQ